MNIDPRHMTVIEWADQMTPLLARLGSVPRLDNPDAWHSWAQNLVALARVARRTPPDPRTFSNWEEWAFRFNQVVPL